MVATKFHFVDDYRKLVRDLIEQYPLPEAMSRAIGGEFNAIGEFEKQLLIGYGLKPDHTLVDVGCGAGRLAKKLVTYFTSGKLLGTDVVQELLDYARVGCPATWQFALVEDIRIPFPDDEADFASFFSVFTHLLHEETYCYMLEARRVVKAGGLIVFSFLEFEQNWLAFKNTVRIIREGGTNDHLNVFIARESIEVWARHLGMTIVDIRSGTERFINLPTPVIHDNGQRLEGSAAFGQSVCVLRNDKRRKSGSSRATWSSPSPYKVTYLAR